MSKRPSAEGRVRPMSDAEARLAASPFLHRRSTAPIIIGGTGPLAQWRKPG